MTNQKKDLIGTLAIVPGIPVVCILTIFCVWVWLYSHGQATWKDFWIGFSFIISAICFFVYLINMMIKQFPEESDEKKTEADYEIFIKYVL